MKVRNLLIVLGTAAALSACGQRAEAPVAEEAPEAQPEAAAMVEAGLPISAPDEAVFAAYTSTQELTDRGAFVEANHAAVALTESAPEFIGSWLLLSNAALSGEQFVQAIKQAQALKADATEAEQLWADVNMSFVTNDTAEGVRKAQKMVELYPDSPRAHMILSGMQTAQADHGAARESAAKAVKLGPDMAATHLTLGFHYMNNEPKDQAAAQEHFQHAIKLQPGEDNHYIALGDSQRAAGDLEAAKAGYSKALEIDSTNAIAAVKRAHANSFLGYYDEARADYDQGIAVGQAQTPSTLANYRAFVHVHEGDPAAAIAELQTVLNEIDAFEIPDDQKLQARIFTLTNMVEIACHNGMDEPATSTAGELSTALMQSGAASGDTDFARQQEATAAYWQSQVAAVQDDYDGATAKAEAFASLLADDDNPRRMERYHELLGFIALRQGDYETAVAEYRQSNLSTSAGGGDVKNIYMLATALKGAGQDEEAAELMDQVANWNFNSVWFAMLRKEAATGG